MDSIARPWQRVAWFQPVQHVFAALLHIDNTPRASSLGEDASIVRLTAAGGIERSPIQDDGLVVNRDDSCFESRQVGFHKIQKFSHRSDPGPESVKAVAARQPRVDYPYDPPSGQPPLRGTLAPATVDCLIGLAATALGGVSSRPIHYSPTWV